MLYCNYCDYLKSTNEGAAVQKKTSVCEFTKFVFMGEIEDYTIEYPCNTMDTRVQYLPNKISGSDWKYTYKKGHTKPAVNREKATA